MTTIDPRNNPELVLGWPVSATLDGTPMTGFIDGYNPDSGYATAELENGFRVTFSISEPRAQDGAEDADQDA